MFAAEAAPSMIIVSSLPTSIFFACPRSSIFTPSSVKPTSSEITVPPVRIAISSSIAFLRSPNPGAFTATALIVPRILFTTKVASASPSISSAIIRRGLLAFATCSSTGSKSLIFAIFLSCNKIYGSSSNAICLSLLLIK